MKPDKKRTFQVRPKPGLKRIVTESNVTVILPEGYGFDLLLSGDALEVKPQHKHAPAAAKSACPYLRIQATVRTAYRQGVAFLKSIWDGVKRK